MKTGLFSTVVTATELQTPLGLTFGCVMSGSTGHDPRKEFDLSNRLFKVLPQVRQCEGEVRQLMRESGASQHATEQYLRGERVHPRFATRQRRISDSISRDHLRALLLVPMVLSLPLPIESWQGPRLG